jgi:hypothetical protein
MSPHTGLHLIDKVAIISQSSTRTYYETRQMWRLSSVEGLTRVRATVTTDKTMLTVCASVQTFIATSEKAVQLLKPETRRFHQGGPCASNWAECRKPLATRRLCLCSRQVKDGMRSEATVLALMKVPLEEQS